MKKSIAASVLAALLLGGTVISALAATTPNSNNIAQFETYLNGLQSGNQQANVALQKFVSLSSSQQQTVLNLLSNPSALKNAIKNKDPEITFSSTNVVSNTVANSVSTNATSSHQYNLAWTYQMGILGVPIIVYAENEIYNVSSGKISLVSSQAYVDYNLDPIVQTSLQAKSFYVNGYNEAEVYAVFSYGIGPYKGLSSQMGITHLNMAGTTRGTPDYETGYTSN